MLRKKVFSALLTTTLVLSLVSCANFSGGGTTSSQTQGSTNPAPETEAKTDMSTSVDSTNVSNVAIDNEKFPEYDGDEVELRFTWWGGQERTDKTNKVIDMFHEMYPKIKIVGEPRPGDSYWDNLNTQIGGGNAPDVMQFGGNYPDFVSRDILLELDQYNGNLLQIDTPEKFDQEVLKTGTMNDHLYVVSLGTNVLTLVYNKTMLENAGAPLPPEHWTWDEMIAYGKKIAPLLPDGVWPFVDNSSNQANYISYFMTQRGEDIWTYEEKSYITEEGVLAWINLWEDMRDEGLIPDIETTAGYADTSVDNSAFVAGKAAIHLIWSNQIGTYQGAMTDEIGLATLPTGEKNALAIQVSQYLAVNKMSEYPDAAALFINFFVNNEEAGKVLGNDRGVSSSPEVRSAIESVSGEQDAMIYQYYNRISDMTIPQGPNLPNDQEFIDGLKRILQSIAFGQVSREDGANELYSLINRLMVK